MRLLEQLELFDCSRPALPATTQLGEGLGRFAARPHGDTVPWLQGETAPWLQHDVDLQARASELLWTNGAARIAKDVHVEWSSRLKSCAGRADYRAKLISLNPRLREHGAAEIDRTLRHELAHLLAQFRAGRRRILPHGQEWRAACRDLGIGDEKRCHNLPFPIRERVRRFLYKCPNCRCDFARVRRIRRAIACLACCRAHNGGEFDPRFKLALVDRRPPGAMLN
jgi:SprT protein